MKSLPSETTLSAVMVNVNCLSRLFCFGIAILRLLKGMYYQYFITKTTQLSIKHIKFVAIIHFKKFRIQLYHVWESYLNICFHQNRKGILPFPFIYFTFNLKSVKRNTYSTT